MRRTVERLLGLSAICSGTPDRPGRITPAERAAYLASLRLRPFRWDRQGLLGMVIATIGWTLSIAVGLVACIATLVVLTSPAIPSWESVLSETVARDLEWSTVRSAFIDTRDEARPAMIAVAVGVGFAASCAVVFAWWTLGARACLRHRSRCSACGHTITDLPIIIDPRSVPKVRCGECGTVHCAIASWGELGASAAVTDAVDHTSMARIRFRPAMNLAPRILTRGRAIRPAVAGLNLIVLAALVWSASTLHWFLDTNRQAAVARTLRLSDEEIAAVINKGRPESGGSSERSRFDLIRELGPHLEATERQYRPDMEKEAEVGRYASSAFHLELIRPSSVSDPKYRSDEEFRQKFGRVLMRVQIEAGADRLLAGLRSAPLQHRHVRWWLRFGEANRDRRWATAEARRCGRFALALLRDAVERDDPEAFAEHAESMFAIIQFQRDQPTMLDKLVEMSIARETLETLDWAARFRPTAPWIAVLDRVARRFEPVDIVPSLELVRLESRDMLASFMSDPVNVRKGYAEALSATSFLGLDDETAAAARRASFSDLDRVIVESIDDLIALARTTSWIERRRLGAEQTALRASDRHVAEALSMNALRRTLTQVEGTELTRRGVQVSLRIEAFRAERGRLPSIEEFATIFASDPAAIDPFSGTLLRYRPLDDRPRTDDEDAPTIVGTMLPTRGYLLYSVNANGTDDGGEELARPWRQSQPDGDIRVP